MPVLAECVAGVFLALSLFAQAPAGDEAAVREVVRKYMDARERVDAHAIEALFTADADQLVSTGEWRRGRGEVVRGTMASSQNTGGKRTIAVESVRFLAPGVALADGRYELTGLAGGAARRMWTTLVVIRSPDGWRIAAIRNMLPAKPAPSR
ncbi:MAG TPA: SgcJ/EcaC family oxidoreductase [Acidobacteriota bacterium]|nr:SgcJ/EcaC family oxidoreductase [Acidobacteriota bacterium]